ncbi:MAG: putative lipid II flippase FtsW [Actinobacteria bacterium]|nr:MAG: putative lipid II flippase FtsW [Actinomycetota bacterium]
MRSQTKNSSYYLLLGVTISLVLFGVIMICSSSSAMAYASTADSFHYLKRQLVYILIGATALVFLSRLDYRRLRQVTYGVVAVALVGLVAVEIPGVGHTAGGAARWIQVGPQPVQPSEIAKLAMLLAGADILARKRDRLEDFNELAVPLLPLVGLFCLLVVFQPDLGTAFTISFAILILAFIAGAPLRHLASIAGGLGVAVVIFIVSEPFRLRRFLAFLDPWSDPQKTGFHIIQSLLAFGSGGWHGIGLGLSRQKFFYLPAAHTDFIFAIVGEELGLIGTLLVVGLFAAFAYAGMRIAFRTRDFYGRLLAAGLTAMVVSQAVINMAAVTGLLPITGIPLPLVSYGGSSLIVTLAAVGIVLNVSSNRAALQGVAGARSRTKSSSVGRRDGGPRLSGAGSRGKAASSRAGASPALRRDGGGARGRRSTKAGA